MNKISEWNNSNLVMKKISEWNNSNLVINEDIGVYTYRYIYEMNGH